MLPIQFQLRSQQRLTPFGAALHLASMTAASCCSVVMGERGKDDLMYSIASATPPDSAC